MNIKEYTRVMAERDTQLFRASLLRRIHDGERVIAGESYIYLNASNNVAERKATQQDIELAIERS